MTAVTWDTVNKGSMATLSNGNLTVSIPNHYNIVRSSIGRSTGKWYCEMRVDYSGYPAVLVGIINALAPLNTEIASTNNVRYYATNGRKFPENIAYASAYKAGDIISILLDLDNGKLEFWKNGVSQGVSHTNLSALGEVFISVKHGNQNDRSDVTANFGDSAFVYDIPTGYMPYGNIAQKKILIKSNTEYSHYDTATFSWINIGSNPTQADYLTHGMEDLSAIPEIAWSQLDLSNAELALWTDEEDALLAAKQLVNGWVTVSSNQPTQEQFVKHGIEMISSIPTSAWGRINGDFEVISWTDQKDNPLQLSLVAMPTAQVLNVTKSLQFTSLDKIQVNYQESGSGKVYIHLSGDQGATYTRFHAQAVNDLTAEELKVLFPSGSLHFKVELSGESTSDQAAFISLSINDKDYYTTPSIQDFLLQVKSVVEKMPLIYVSYDRETTWVPVPQNELFSLSQEETNALTVKIVLEDGQELYAISYSWI